MSAFTHPSNYVNSPDATLNTTCIMQSVRNVLRGNASLFPCLELTRNLESQVIALGLNASELSERYEQDTAQPDNGFADAADSADVAERSTANAFDNTSDNVLSDQRSGALGGDTQVTGALSSAQCNQAEPKARATPSICVNGRTPAQRGSGEHLSVKLRQDLQALASHHARQTMNTTMTVDPMLGADSNLTSVGAKLQRQHGIALPNALALVLTSHGLVVMKEVSLPLCDTSMTLGVSNTITQLKELKFDSKSTDFKTYCADLVVRCPKTGWIGAFDAKRGNGLSDNNARETLSQKLRATYVILRKWAHGQNYTVTAQDARVIDYYGSSGYAADLRITGTQLDAYFGIVGIEDAMAWFSRCFFEAGAKVRHLSGSKSAQQDMDRASLDQRDFSFGAQKPASAQSLFDAYDEMGNDLITGSSFERREDSLSEIRLQIEALRAAYRHAA